MNDLERFCGADDVAIATALVDLGLRTGAYISVNDGEEWTVRKSQDRTEILNALGSTGSDVVLLRSPAGHLLGRYLLVYGNGDGTTIADYSGPADAEDLYQKLQPTLERYG